MYFPSIFGRGTHYFSCACGFRKKIPEIESRDNG